MNRTRSLKILLLIVWLILFGMLLKRDVLIDRIDRRELQALEKADREEFQSIYFKNKKIGYVKSTYTSRDTGTDDSFALLVDQVAHMRLNILETIHPIDLHLQATLNKESRLQDFKLSFQSPFYQMEAEGVVDQGRVSFTLTTNNSVIHDTIQLDDAPMLSTTRRGYLLRQDLHVGDKIKVPWFDPISLTGKDSVIEYKGKEKILIHNRIFNLHRFLEKFNGAGISLWLDDQGRVMKEQSPAGFIFLREAEFKATKLEDSSDELLSAVAVKVIGKMVPLEGRQSIRYRLHLPDLASYDLDGGRQSLQGDLLQLTQETIPDQSSQPKSSPQPPEDTLSATPFIQADHGEITALRQSILGEETNQLQQARHLTHWVYTHISKRPVMGLPDALTTLKNRQGDCNEHAALFAALARNSGIPTRFVAGVTYHQHRFYYHAWNEVLLKGRWISLDTTLNQFPADLGHIRFIAGDIKEQMRIGGLLGQLSIEVVRDE